MMTCDICGYTDKTTTFSVVHPGNDGVRRCKLCRQRAMYGHTFAHDKDEFKAYKAGKADLRFDIANPHEVTEWTQ